MPKLVTDAPHTDVDAVTEILHGIPVSDSYRWLEDQESPQTRAWIDAQQRHARSYFEAIPERDRIRRRVAELLDVETYDSLQKVGQRYFFRKRLRGREQPGIFFRESPEGPDRFRNDTVFYRTEKRGAAESAADPRIPESRVLGVVGQIGIGVIDPGCRGRLTRNRYGIPAAANTLPGSGSHCCAASIHVSRKTPVRAKNDLHTALRGGVRPFADNGVLR